MNLFDIIVFIIMSVIIIRAWLKGFAGTLLSFASFVVSAIAAWTLYPSVAKLIDFGEIPHTVLCGVSIIIVYAISMLICTVISFFVNSFFKIPVLKTLNKLLGLVLGIICALIFAKIASVGVLMFYEGMNIFAPDRFDRELIDTSVIIKIFN